MPRTTPALHGLKIPGTRLGGNPVIQTVAASAPTGLVFGACLVIWAVLATAQVPSALARAAWTLPILAIAQLSHEFAPRVAANSRMLISRELQERLAIADRQVLSTAHGELASLARSLDQCRTVLARSHDRGALELRALLDDVLSACQRARRQSPSSVFPDVQDALDESSSLLVDRWARVERTPAWWPMGVRELWALTAASWLDSIRLLHTREIERVALAGTLLLRASLVAIAPVSGALTIAGTTPFVPHTAQWRGVVWAMAASWTLLTAIGAPWIVWRIIDRDDSTTRQGLLAWESILSVAVLLAAPSWLTFSLVAGPLNWALRPRWSSRLLTLATAAFTGIFATGLVLAPMPASGERLLVEVLIGLACLGLISNSFGLLLPIVVAHVLFVLPAWHRNAAQFQQLQWRDRTEPIAAALNRAIQRAERDRHTSPVVAEAAAQLRRAEIHIRRLLVFPQRRVELIRRRALGQVVEIVLDRAARDPAHPLRAAAPSFDPPDLAGLRLPSWRVTNHLEIALARIASEALRHGEFEIRCACSVAQDEVVIRVENDIAPGSADIVGQGAARGSREIRAAVSQLPGGRLVGRRVVTGASGIPVFEVEFAFTNEEREP